MGAPSTVRSVAVCSPRRVRCTVRSLLKPLPVCVRATCGSRRCGHIGCGGWPWARTRCPNSCCEAGSGSPSSSLNRSPEPWHGADQPGAPARGRRPAPEGVAARRRSVNFALEPEQVTLLDWSLATWGPPRLDFAIFLAGALTQVRAARADIVADVAAVAGLDRGVVGLMLLLGLM